MEWILKELIKPFQKSIGSVGPTHRSAKEQKVDDDSHMCYFLTIDIVVL